MLHGNLAGQNPADSPLLDPSASTALAVYMDRGDQDVKTLANSVNSLKFCIT